MTWRRSLAERVGLKGRGSVATGGIADLAVIDLQRVRDASTYASPMLPPLGVPHVLVGGRAVVRDGVLTGARPGWVLAAG